MKINLEFNDYYELLSFVNTFEFNQRPKHPSNGPVKLSDLGIYAGILLGKNCEPDQAIYLLAEKKESCTWNEAVDFAKSLNASLPTRREQALLYANLPEEFQKEWYWSCEQLAAYVNYAWLQYFRNGNQDGSHKSFKYHARFVRRSPI